MPKQVDHVNQKPECTGEAILDRIHAVMHVFRARQYRASRGVPAGLTHMESKALGFFARRPGASQGDLVAHSGRDKGQVARMIAGLRERGLLEAQPDESDRRSVRLRLTAAGSVSNRAVQRRARRLAAMAMKGLDEAERRQLASLLERVQVNLDAAESNE